MSGSARHRALQFITTFFVVAILLVPVRLPLLEAESTCVCGMKKGSCTCKLLIADGAQCHVKNGRKGRCSMGSSERQQVLPSGLDLRGWLRPRPFVGIAADPSPSGLLPRAEVRFPPSHVPLPEVPPPRPFRIS